MTTLRQDIVIHTGSSTTAKEVMEMVALDEVRSAILAALATMDAPAGCGEIAKKAGLATPKVVGKMRGLLKDDLVERPVQGEYIISESGRSL